MNRLTLTKIIIIKQVRKIILNYKLFILDTKLINLKKLMFDEDLPIDQKIIEQLK